MQQKISSPSVLSVRDSVILSTNPYLQPYPYDIPSKDPWNDVLSNINEFALAPATIRAALNGTISPSATNPLMTSQHFTTRMIGVKTHVLVGPPGSNCDFVGTDETPFIAAIAELQVRNPNGGWIVVEPATYSFRSPLTVPAGVRIEGMSLMTTILTTQAGFPTSAPLITLSGSQAELSFLTVSAPQCTGAAAIKTTGTRCTIERVLITDFPLLGVQLYGPRSYMRGCRIESNTGSGVWIQNLQQRVSLCSFGGTLPNGAVRIEGSQCGLISSYMESTVVSSLNIINAVCTDNFVVGNHLGSAPIVDNGTNTVLYANTPNSANTNDFVNALAAYVGQPTPSTTVMHTSNSFTHADSDATTIWSALDLFIQQSYEERNFFLISPDPTYDTTGVPLTGMFSWDGPTSTITWPAFSIKSVTQPYFWNVAAGSTHLLSKQALVVTLDRTGISSSDITPTPVVKAIPIDLAVPADAQNFVLAVGLGNGNALWMEGFRLLGSVSMSHTSLNFDIDGYPMPTVRFIGAMPETNDPFNGITITGTSDLRNPPPPFDGFAAGTAADLATKLGAQSALIKQLFERTNLSYQRTSADAEVRTEVQPDGWLPLVGLPGTPTHFLNLQGTTYCLVPTFGLYHYDRPNAVFDLVRTGSFTSMSRLGTGLALLGTDHTISYFEPDAPIHWVSITPNVNPYLPTTFGSTISASFQSGGMSDFCIQTPRYSYFTTLDGTTVRFSKANNTLELVPRVFQGALGTKGLIGSHTKDTGYNAAIDPDSLMITGNGGFSTIDGLPGGSTSALTIPTQNGQRLGIASFNPELMQTEALSHDYDSGQFLAVYRSAGSTYYVFGGGFGVSTLYDVLPPSRFSSSQPMSWVLNASSQTCVLLGQDSSGNMSEWYGSVNGGIWSWTLNTSLSALAIPCTGVVGIIDRYGDGDVWALASSAGQPIMLKRNGGSWNVSNTFGAIAFSYTYSTDAQKAFGVSSPGAVSFLIQNGSGNQTLLYYNRSAYLTRSLVYTGLSQQFYGGFYHPTFQSLHWFAKSGSGSFIHFMALESSAYMTWDVATIGTGGSYLASTSIAAPSFTKRSGSSACCKQSAANSQGWSNVVDYVYLTTPNGTIQGALTGNGQTGLTTQAWTILDKRAGLGSALTANLPCYSSAPTSTYQDILGFSRSDISIQIGSRIEPTLPLVAAVSTGVSDTGVLWYDSGIKVRQASSTVWVGLNRTFVSGGSTYGYLWVADTTVSTRQTELMASGAAYRGDIIPTIINSTPTSPSVTFGSADDYDMAWDGSNRYLAIVYRNNPRYGYLGLLLYDAVQKTFQHQTLGVGENGTPGTVTSLGSVPRIVWNSSGYWSIVGQTTSSHPEYYTFTVAKVWTAQQVLAISNANAPSKPVISGANIYVAYSSTGSSLMWLQGAGGGSSPSWSVIYQSTAGGFARPQTAVPLDNSGYWVFGSYDGSNPGRVAFSATPASGWGVVSTPTSYGRMQTVVASLIPSATSSVVAAAPLLADGSISANQEAGVFRFTNGSWYASAFTAKGRLQSSTWSGDEESSFADLSFTPDNRLIYRALRPNRTTPHWSIRTSLNGWQAVGESLLGSGRFVTIGDVHFREQWVGESTQPLIQSYGVNGLIRTSTYLPIAQRTIDDYVLLNWPYAATTGYLFGSGSTTWADDTGLQSGALPAASARQWPMLAGQTLFGMSGAASLYWGSMFALSASYLGTVGSNGLFKNSPINYLSLYGSHSWIDPATGANIPVVGPLRLRLNESAVGSHVVMQFAVSQPTVDVLANPLTGWSAFDYPTTHYVVALAELRDQNIVVYPKLASNSFDNKLTYAVREPFEPANQPPERQRFFFPSPFASMRALPQQYNVDALTADTIRLSEIGSIRGIQSVSLPAGTDAEIILRGAVPGGGTYLAMHQGAISPCGLLGEIIYVLAGRYGALLSWHESLT